MVYFACLNDRHWYIPTPAYLMAKGATRNAQLSLRRFAEQPLDELLEGK
jgi:hypothetical protein